MTNPWPRIGSLIINPGKVLAVDLEARWSIAGKEEDRSLRGRGRNTRQEVRGIEIVIEASEGVGNLWRDREFTAFAAGEHLVLRLPEDARASHAIRDYFGRLAGDPGAE
jgi:hypothetical protein